MLKKINIQFLFSYFGLIPYTVVFLDKYFFFIIKEDVLFNFITYYSLIIIVFIGSINWNLKENPPTHIIVYGFLPSLFSVLIIILNLYNINTFIIFILIIFLLLTQLFFDYTILFSNEKNKRAFYFLRLPLTILISIFLLLILL
tara:strand:+ start:1470 stop:1901 length:432 start_codon:yes stop_codon:yes gene_type:complete